MGQRQSERQAAYKAAFNEVIGDPYNLPEPITGSYARYKTNGLIGAAANDFDGSPTTINQARPSTTDFFCDVDRALEDGFKELGDRLGDSATFLNTYVVENDRLPLYTQQERAEIEQVIGRLFYIRRISPVKRYFTVMRQKLGAKK